MQQQQPASQPQPLYTPISFILTQTIGLSPQLPSSPTSPSLTGIPPEYKYKDIVVPVSVGSVDLLYLYYMFHVPVLYNWLRGVLVVGSGCFQRKFLGGYLRGDIKGKELVRGSSKGGQFRPQTIVQTLHKLTPKYSLLKTCLQPKLQILKPTSSPNPNQPQCKHNLKLSLHSSSYSYNKEKSRLQINKYYCKECQREIEVSLDKGHYQVEELPLAPIFEGFYGGKIGVYLGGHEGKERKVIKFRISQIYTEKRVYIEAANGLWYRADIMADQHGARVQEMKVCGEIAKVFEEAAGKKWRGLCVYVREEMVTNCGVLKLATKLDLPSSIQQTKNKLQNPRKKEIEAAFRQPKQERQQQLKVQQKTVQPHAIDQQPLQMPEQPYNPHNTIILPETLPQESAQKYKESVQKLYPKQKEKDEYERDYDKGKTKKIKKKVESIRPDFNQIFKTVRKDNEELIAGLRQPEKKNRRIFRKDQPKEDGDGQNGEKKDGKDGGRQSKFKPGGRDGKQGKFSAGRKQFKQWKKHKKQKFIKKFDSA